MKNLAIFKRRVEHIWWIEDDETYGVITDLFLDINHAAAMGNEDEAERLREIARSMSGYPNNAPKDAVIRIMVKARTKVISTPRRPN